MGPTHRSDNAGHADHRQRCGSDEAGDHESAVVRAEVNRLVRALRLYGVLRRDVLAREARAGSWHEGSFEGALETAVDEHRIEELPLGFYRLPDTGLHHIHPESGESAD